jgi:hypothetical protein
MGPEPIIIFNQAAVREIKEVAILPPVNATSYQEVSHLVYEVLSTELALLGRFKFKDPQEVRAAIKKLGLQQRDFANPLEVKRLGQELDVDGVFVTTVMSYTPVKKETVLKEKDEDIRATSFEEEKRELKKRTGCLGGALVEILIPDVYVWRDERREYETYTQNPSIGLGLFLVDTHQGMPVFKASKVIDENARLPGCYWLTYKDVLRKENFLSAQFIATLAMKEMLEPLKPRGGR